MKVPPRSMAIRMPCEAMLIDLFGEKEVGFSNNIEQRVMTEGYREATG
jgi:hypothetical protein